MAKDEVLGISGYFDISDIEKSFNELLDSLHRTGAEVDSISQKFKTRLQEIANASDKDLATKTAESFALLLQTIRESNAEYAKTEDILRGATKEAERFAKAKEKLEKERADTVIGSDEYNNLTAQINEANKALKLAEQDVSDLQQASAGYQDTLKGIMQTYEAFSKGNASANEQVKQSNEDAKMSLKEYKQSLKEAEAALKEFKKENPNFSIQGAEDSIKRQERRVEYAKKRGGENEDNVFHKEIVSAQNAIDKLKDLIATYNRLTSDIEEYKKAISEEENKPTEKTTSLRTQLTQMRNELAQLSVEYAKLSEAERQSASGQEMLMKIQALQEEAAQLQDAYKDASDAIRARASDTSTFDGILQGLNLVTSGMATAQGAAVSLGLSEEDLVAVQTNLQTALAASNFLQEAQNSLRKESALMDNVYKVQRYAATLADELNTKAKEKNIVATYALTAAQRVLNAVAKANHYVLLAVALLTVVGAIAGLTIAYRKNKEEADNAAKAAEAQKKKAREATEMWANSVARSAAKQIASYKSMQNEWNKLGDDMKAKKAFTEDNQRAFEDLGWSIQNVTDAENILVANSDNVVKAIMARAKAAAYENLITKAYEDYIKSTVQKGGSVKSGDYKRVYKEGQDKSKISKFVKEEYGYTLPYVYTSPKLSEEEVAKLNELEAKKAQERKVKWNKELKAKKDAHDKYVGALEKGMEDQLEVEKKLRDKISLPKTNNKTEGSGGRTITNKETKKEIESSALETRQILLDLEDETTTKRIEQIHLDYDKAIAEVKKKEKELREARGGQLTEEDTNLLNAKTLAAETNKDKALAAIRKEELEAMRNYLKEYGTLEQQRLAITEEYAEKIKNAQTEGERKTLEQQKQRDLSAINAQYFKQQIDWSSVLGEFGTMLRSEIKHNLELISGYMQGDEFKNMLPTDQQTIIDARNRLEEGLGGSLADVSFKKIGQLVSEFEANMAAYNLAKETEKEITENLIKAQEGYKKALKTGDQAQIKAAKTTLDTAQNQADMQASIVKGAERALSDSATSLSDANRKAVTAINGVADALSAIKSGSLQQAYNGIGNLAGSLADVATGGLKDVLSSISEAFGVPMIDAILGVADLLKDGISTVIVDLLNMVTNAVNGILSDILSGDIITEVLKANYKGVGKILNTITFGGLNSWLGVGGNAAEVQATIDRLTDRNELLTTAVENLTEEMEVNRGMMTIQQAKQAQQYQREKEENLKEIAQAQASYSSSHHSWNYYWGGFTEAEIAKFSEKIGRQWDGDIWSLSPSEMKELQSTVDMWNKIQQTGEGGYGERVTERLEDYIAEAGKLEEITDQLNETMTSISFKGLYDSFIDSLMDMEQSAEDIADNIVEYFQRAMLSYSIGEAMYEDLEAWYQKYAEYAEEGLTSREIDELEKEYQKFVEEGVRRRDEIASLTGYSDTFKDSESATSKGIENITSEQANALEGIGIAIQIAVEQGNDLKQSLTEGVDVISVNTISMANNISEIRVVQNRSLTALQQISANTSVLPAIAEDISQLKRSVNELR